MRKVPLTTQKFRILFIDPDFERLESFKQQFDGLEMDWTAEYHQNSQTALDSIAQEDSVVIVADLEMPRPNGLDICDIVWQEKVKNQSSLYLVVLSEKVDLNSLETALGRGADDFISREADMVEIISRIKVGHREIRLKNELLELNRKLLWESQRDSLTRLYNRRYGYELLKRELEKVERGIQDLTLLMLDIDYFKRINDTYGHNFGDSVLHHTAIILQQSVRKYDSIIRWGGEEFLIVLPNTRLEDGLTLAERIRQRIEEDPLPEGSTNGDFKYTVSIGVANRPKDSVGEGKDFVENLDRSLYIAKNNGRNQVATIHAQVE